MVSVAREEAGLRLRLGQVLELMRRQACCFELGFSSLAAYALERCERGVRWVEVACCLARRLEVLPVLRGALATGQLGWSVGELLARVARPENEARWLELARERTVRELRQEVTRARGVAAVDIGVGKADRRVAGNDAAQGGIAQDGIAQDGTEDDVGRMEEREARCALVFTLNREDAWLLEATRALLDQLGTHGTEEQLEALLAEGQGALLAALPWPALDVAGLEPGHGAQQRWREQLALWREQAEERCEPRIRRVLLERAVANTSGLARQAAQGTGALEGSSARELDAIARQLASDLAGHELQLAQLLWRVHRADGWRRLGYATETQYARERLGLSRSSLVARRSLALRLAALPQIAAALGHAEIGVEAALQLVRVATPGTELAWLERARRRTVKHLREEVAAALVAVRLSGEVDCSPPEPAELGGFQELERAVLSGQVGGGTPNLRQLGGASVPSHGLELAGESRATQLPQAESPQAQSPEVQSPQAQSSRATQLPQARSPEARRPWRLMLGSLAAWLAQGALGRAVQMSASSGRGEPARRTCSAGRVPVRWRVSVELRAWWHTLEMRARRWLPCGMSWVRYLCLVFWRAWGHMVGVNVAWGQVYLRDLCRCSSPVCSRRDVTPHHLRFRSAGGSDDLANLTSLCTWCHLRGVHGGRIRAAGRADHIVWELGSRGEPCLRVDGRERLGAPGVDWG